MMGGARIIINQLTLNEMRNNPTVENETQIVNEIARAQNPETMRENLRDLMDFYLVSDEDWSPEHKDSVYSTFMALDQALINIIALKKPKEITAGAMSN